MSDVQKQKKERNSAVFDIPELDAGVRDMNKGKDVSAMGHTKSISEPAITFIEQNCAYQGGKVSRTLKKPPQDLVLKEYKDLVSANIERNKYTVSADEHTYSNHRHLPGEVVNFDDCDLDRRKYSSSA